MDLSVSLSTGFYADLSPEAAVDELAAAGFGCCEFGLEHGIPLLERGGSAEKLGADLRAYAADKGLQFPQGHLHMDLDICDPKDLDTMKVWLDLFRALGVRSAVLHATGAYDQPWEKQLELRGGAIRALADHIRDTDMVICLENLFSNP